MAEQNKKFSLGRTVATCNVDDFFRVDASLAKDGKSTMAFTLLQKHQNLEQGDLCDSDYQQNLDAVKNEGKKDNNGQLMQDRIQSSFTINGTKFWVITEWDRSATTILFPSEY